VKKVVIFHHDPLHNDEFMDRVQEETRKRFPNSIVAYEGLEIDVLAEAAASSDGQPAASEAGVSA
jgi:hypothetical protein